MITCYEVYCILMFSLLQHKKTAFHLAAKGGHLLCLQLLFAAAESRGLLRFLPKIDKVKYISHMHIYVIHESHYIEWMEPRMSC